MSASSTPAIRRSASGSSVATVHQDGTVSFFSILDQSWRRSLATSLVAGHAPERDSFSTSEWNRVCRRAEQDGACVNGDAR